MKPARGAGILWLVGAAVFLTLSNGRWHLAVAAWLAPFFLRMFLMTRPVVRGLLLGLTVQLLASTAHWTEIIPAPGFLYFLIAGIYALVYFLPFAIDRLLAPRLPVFASTLVLPSTWFLAESLVERWTPYGSWASLGYTQMDLLPLAQLASFTGVAGIGFVITWTAAVISTWLLRPRDAAPRRIPLMVVWGTTIGIILLGGELRLAPAPPDTKHVRIALLTPSATLTSEFGRAMLPFRMGDTDNARLAPVRDLARRINEDLLERSRREANVGARIVVWSETAGRVLQEEEADWVDKGRQLARDEGIYLFMSLGTWRRHETPPLENKIVAITPDGEVAWQHQKARPIVGAESGFILPRHDVLPTLDSPFGRLAAVICHDLDFPDFIRQAGRKKVDVLFAPSADWSVITTLHAKMARARAIENGLTLVRPTYDGLSLIADARGRTVSSAYDVSVEDRSLVGLMPVHRVSTVYPAVGGLLIWPALAVLVFLIIMALRSGRLQPRGAATHTAIGGSSS